ncbi:hypothetical protein AGMMS49992_10700 [Clostridia bacterium]|nr:hypothetical protein AGMMS49992_10700 [Clostridia bacterium]
MQVNSERDESLPERVSAIPFGTFGVPHRFTLVGTANISYFHEIILSYTINFQIPQL